MKLYKRTKIAGMVALSGSLTVVNSISAFGAGYICTGGDGSGGNMVFFDKLNFSTETSAKLTSVLSVKRAWGAGVNSYTKGYFSGSGNGNTMATVDSLNYVTESTMLLTTTLSNSRDGLAGVSYR